MINRPLLTGPPAVDSSLNQVIAAMCRAEKLTQAALGEKLWMSRASVNERMNGRRPWTVPDLMAIAEILGIKLSKLIALAEAHVRARQ